LAARARSAAGGLAIVAAAGGLKTGPGPSAMSANIDPLLDSIRVANNLPAVGAAIVTRDSIWALGVVGIRRIGDTTRATPADLFHLGSDLKSMTAGMIGTLVDEGRLTWTATMAELLPDLASTMRPEYRSVTLHDLLSHQSGLVPNATIPFSGPDERAQRVRFLSWVFRQPSVSPRGTYSYANSNYTVAGAIAERLCDESYEQLMFERIFRPLGMTTVGWGAAGTRGKVDQPWQHRIGPFGAPVAVQPGPDADNPPVMSPAGRAHMSVHDWALWVRAVLRAEAGDSSLWRPATARMLVAPAVRVDANTSYALGWLTTSRSWAGPTGRTLTHVGSNTMNVADVWVAPDAGFAVLAVTNQGGDTATRAMDGVVSRLIQLYHGARP